MRLIIIFIMLAMGAPSRTAIAFWGDSDGPLGLDGSVKTFFFLFRDRYQPSLVKSGKISALSYTNLRLTAIGRPRPSLRYEIHWVGDFTTATEPTFTPTGFPLAGISMPRYRVIDASWDLLDGPEPTATASFDRFNVRWSSSWFDLTVGRQAITFGKTYFWNPLDVFSPFSASQIDREYKSGVDALRIDIPLGLYSGMTLIGAPGARLDIRKASSMDPSPGDATWYGTALVTHLFTDVRGWDVAIQGGKIYGGWQLGLAVVGDWGPLQWRGEVAQFWAADADPLPYPLEGDQVTGGLSAVCGIGHRFGNDLTIDVEYLYNGLADPEHPDESFVRTQSGASLQSGRHYLAALGTYQMSPLVLAQLSGIASLADGSWQLQPTLDFSLSDEMDLLIGVSLNFGSPPATGPLGSPEINSDFGSLPHTGFFEWKFYF